MKSSYKTTTFGLMAALGTAVTTAHAAGMIHDLPKWLGTAAELATVLGIGGIGFFARDNDKTSEDVGAKNTPTAPGRQAPLLSIGFALLLCGAGMCFAFTGCQSTPQRIAYNTVAAPVITLDEAMRAFADYAKEHPLTAQQMSHARVIYGRAQAAELLAIDTAKIASAAASGPNGVQAALRSQQAQQQFASALADLLTFLRALGVKI